MLIAWTEVGTHACSVGDSALWRGYWKASAEMDAD